MKTYLTKSSSETESAGEQIGENLEKGSVVALFGDLGAGKTCITRGIVKGYGIDCRVSSPTFSIVNEYVSGSKKICHYDMYRITTWDDLYSTGFFDNIETDAVLIIEWSENIEEALPENYIKLVINKCDDENHREIIIGRKDEFENSCS